MQVPSSIRRLVLLMPLLLVLLSGCAKQWVASTTFQYTNPAQPEPEKYLRGLLPANDSSVELSAVHNTELFQIRVRDTDPTTAATRANDLASALQKTIQTTDAGAKFKIWDSAEVPPASGH